MFESAIAKLKGNYNYGRVLEQMKIKEKIKTLFEELFKYHHQREFSGKIHEELLPIAWHQEKGSLRKCGNLEFIA